MDFLDHHQEYFFYDSTGLSAFTLTVNNPSGVNSLLLPVPTEKIS